MILQGSSIWVMVIFSALIYNFSSANEEFVKNHQHFSTEFYWNLAQQNEGKSLIFSPFSLQSCFSLLYMGLKDDTASEVEKGFHLGSSDRQAISNNFKEVIYKYKDNQQLKLFNKVYVDVDTTLNPKFEEQAKENFLSEVETINLKLHDKSAEIINNWIKEKSNGKIEQLVKPDDFNSLTRLILLNAIYYKGTWKYPFDKEKTEKGDFWISENESKNVDMMNVETAFKFKFHADLQSIIVEIPYADSDLSMILLIPKQRDGLHNLESKLKETNLADLSSGFVEHRVSLFVPKFKAETEVVANDILKQMGVKKIFEGGDFSDLVKADSGITVSKVVHKAIIEVSEEGTEASAATVAVVKTRVGARVIKADRPFMFIIKDSAGRSFFAGRFLGEN